MEKTKGKILILENDIYFREMLEDICGSIGEVTCVADLESVVSLLSKNSFQLIMVNWSISRAVSSSFYSLIKNFQPNIPLIALFLKTDLPSVVAAMKAGSSDIVCFEEPKYISREKISECLLQSDPSIGSRSYLSGLAESLTDISLHQKTPLFKARKEFSKTFLRQILNQQKLRRTQLAQMLNVSPRTLHRHLSA